jgi:phage gp16-like protein
MNPVRKTASAGNGHIAAIHILKAQLQMTQEDYRALLVTLTGEDTCKGMSDKDLQNVRLHMHKLVGRMGVSTGKFKPFPFVKTAKKPLEPMEKKVWAIWYALEAKGLVHVPESRQARAKALRAYVARQTGATDMAFCTGEQLNKLVEAMKKWLERGKDETMLAEKESAK